MPRWNPTRLLVFALVLAGCVGTSPRIDETANEDRGRSAPNGGAGTQAPHESAAQPDEPVRFVAWGDAGHGSPEQYRVGEAARRVCEREGCDFVLQLGDNIYDTGAKNVSDPQFLTKFELPYANLSLPFYVVLGNHDVAKPGPDGVGDNGDVQVAYDDIWGGPSAKWNMPARDYSFRQGDAEFWALDLTPLMARTSIEPDERAEAEAVAAEMGASDATWRFAFAHFPYVSNGDHGNAGRYDGREGQGGAVKEYVEAAVCDRADIYFAAHDHDLEWLRPVPACGATEFIISGAASEPDPIPRSDVAAYFSQGNTLGFFWFEVDGDTLTGRAYDGKGNALFERTLEK